MVTINRLLEGTGTTQQEYNEKQEVLIPSVRDESVFNPSTDRVVFTLQTVGGEVLYTENNLTSYQIRHVGSSDSTENTPSIVLFPDKDILEAGYDLGVYRAFYNFYRAGFDPNFDRNDFYISQISPSRTEIRLQSNTVNDETLAEYVRVFTDTLTSDRYFRDFYIEIEGKYYIANNIQLDTTTDSDTVLIKLYSALESSITLNTLAQPVFETAETAVFEAELTPDPIEIPGDKTYIKGPNLNVSFGDQTNNSTTLLSGTDLLDGTPVTSSYYELRSLLNKKGIALDIDFTNLSEFNHFGSAQARYENFFYKVGQIEAYQNDYETLDNTPLSLEVSRSKADLQSNISNIITNFDDFEHFLYFTSSSNSYPKTNSTKPYELASTGSTEALTWLGSEVEGSTYYGGQLLSASNYDKDNMDRLFNSVPTYLREDPANASYEVFLNMIGQHFDNIFVYINQITDLYDADNRLDKGVSKDLVADALRSMGIKLYESNFATNDLYSTLLGTTASGSNLPPTGSEVIDTFVTASSEYFPLANVGKETYKRLYHNLPYLLKKKGTVEGLRALITTFGIPETILRISEFGGKDISHTDDYDYFQQVYNQAFYSETVADYVEVGFDNLHPSWSATNDRPSAIAFRVKPTSIPTTDDYRLLTVMDGGSNGEGIISVTYEPTPFTGSYNGEISASNHQNALVQYWENGTKQCEVDVPFYNGEWWSIYLQSGSQGGSRFELRAGSKTFNGNDGFQMGHYASNQGDTNEGSWELNETLFLPAQVAGVGKTLGGNSYTALQGLWQELRYYNTEISEETFKNFVMNPYSIEGSTALSSADDIVFRATLGTDLICPSGSSESTHPRSEGVDVGGTTVLTCTPGTWDLPTLGDNTYGGYTPGTCGYSTSATGITRQAGLATSSLQLTADNWTTASSGVAVAGGTGYVELENFDFGDVSDYTAVTSFLFQARIDSGTGHSVDHFVTMSVSSSLTSDWEQLGTFVIASASDSGGEINNFQDFTEISKYLTAATANTLKVRIENNTADVGILELDNDTSTYGGIRLGFSKVTHTFTSASVSGGGFVQTTFSGSGSNNYSAYNAVGACTTNTEYIYQDQAIGGARNRISEKIRLDSPTVEGSTLSAYSRITQDKIYEDDYTPNVEYLEVAFSPQNEVNDEINAAMGYFNIGEYIGDPRHVSESRTSYQDLDTIRDDFFQRASGSYNYQDYGRLIKYFDNSLFRMIKDFVPARTGVTTGLVVKPHILERNKVRPAQLTVIQDDYVGTISSSLLQEGSGWYPTQSNQTWNETVDTPVGPQTVVHDEQAEFINGELSGTAIIATDGELNATNTAKLSNPVFANYDYFTYFSNVTDLDYFINPATSPNTGEAYFYVTNFETLEVSHIKVNKTDGSGVNQTGTVTNATDVRLVFDGLTNPIDVDVIQIVDQGDHVLYYLAAVSPTIGTNGGFLDYDLQISGTLPSTASAEYFGEGAYPFINIQTGSATIISNPEGFYKGGDDGGVVGSFGVLDLTQTPNVDTKVTCSVEYSVQGGGNVFGSIPTLALVKRDSITSMAGVKYLTQTQIDYALAVTLLTTTDTAGSFTFTGDLNNAVEGEYYIGLWWAINEDIEVNSISLHTDPLYPSSSAPEVNTIFTPDVPDFGISDDNVLMNNAEASQESQFNQTVVYNNGSVIPTNFDLIINGTAIPAELQDSNYVLTGAANARYRGTRISSPDFNVSRR